MIRYRIVLYATKHLYYMNHMIWYNMVSVQSIRHLHAFIWWVLFERNQYHTVWFVWDSLAITSHELFFIAGGDSFLLCVRKWANCSTTGLSRSVLWLLWYCLCRRLLQCLHYFVTQLIVIFRKDVLMIFIFC